MIRIQRLKNRIASDESGENMSDEWHILKPKILRAINQICQKKKRPGTYSICDFITRTCATNISKELIIELIIEKLTARIVTFNKKAAQGIDSFHELNEKKSL